MFPLVVGYEEGLKRAGEPSFPSVYAYLLFIRDTYIRDTAFKYTDVYEIHENLRKLRPEKYPYAKSRMTQGLWNLKSRGHIVVFDGHDPAPENHTLMWRKFYFSNLGRNLEQESEVDRIVGAAVNELLGF